jgi:hypothetical protein
MLYMLTPVLLPRRIYSTPLGTQLVGDSRQILRELPDCSVDLIGVQIPVVHNPRRERATCLRTVLSNSCRRSPVGNRLDARHRVSHGGGPPASSVDLWTTGNCTQSKLTTSS